MVKRAEEMKVTLKEKMRGGDGTVISTELLAQGEYKGKARLVATLTLEQGCSIGEHIHENEEEIFYVTEGEAVYNDNGVTTVMKKGDSCLCPGGQKHSIANEKPETLTVVAVILTY